MKRISDKKQVFVTPVIEIVVFDSSDIITESGQGGGFEGAIDSFE